MSDILDPLVFAISESKKDKGKTNFKLGEVMGTVGGVQVRFDGESITSPRAYKRLSSYTAVVGHRVLLARVGTTWVVVGNVV